MGLANTLCIDKCAITQSTLEEDLTCMVHMVLNNAPFSDAKLEEAEKATAENTTMRILQTMLHDVSWPDKISEAHSSIKSFWTYWEELTKANDLILKGEKIVIHQSLRKKIINRIHSHQLGMIKCQEWVKDVIIWPEMLKQMEETITKCEICQEHHIVECQRTNNHGWASIQCMASSCNRSI